MSNAPTIPFTGAVVTYNEDERLRECLESLSFCDELLVFDLGSTDRSVEIAKSCGATVIPHERVPTAGAVRKSAAQEASNDWIVYLDPDEVFPTELYPELCRLIDEDPQLGRIYVPWKFYFKGEPLHGTRWGGENYKGQVVHRKRCTIGPPENKYAHEEMSLKPQYTSAHIPWEKGMYIDHYWMESYYGLIEKHVRYIKNEGVVRYERGERFSVSDIVKSVPLAFKNSFIDSEGWKEGGKGLFLSVFWALYVGASQLSLLYQQNVRSQDD